MLKNYLEVSQDCFQVEVRDQSRVLLFEEENLTRRYLVTGVSIRAYKKAPAMTEKRRHISAIKSAFNESSKFVTSL
jgi:hypothetical protein